MKKKLYSIQKKILSLRKTGKRKSLKRERFRFVLPFYPGFDPKLVLVSILTGELEFILRNQTCSSENGSTVRERHLMGA